MHCKLATLDFILGEQGIAELLVKLHRWLQSQLVCALRALGVLLRVWE